MLRDNHNINIDAYIRGEMTQQQRIAFEQELKTNPLLNKDYELTMHILEAIKTRQKMAACTRLWMAQSKMEPYETQQGEITALADYYGSCDACEVCEDEAEYNVSIKKKSKKAWWIFGPGIAIAAGLCAILVFKNNVSVAPEMQTSHIAHLENENSRDIEYEYMAPPADKSQEIILEESDNAAEEDVYYSLSPSETLMESTAEICEVAPDSSCIMADDAIAEEAEAEAVEFDAKAYEKQWTKINILLDAGSIKVALDILKDYRLIDGPHKEEAEKIWKKYNPE